MVRVGRDCGGGSDGNCVGELDVCERGGGVVVVMMVMVADGCEL